MTGGSSKKNRFVRLVLVAAAITLSAIIQSTMAIHLLTILQAQGVKLATAVALGTLVGPSQVLARVLEMIIGRHFHPIWTAQAGFDNIDIEATRVYSIEDAGAFLSRRGLDVDALAREVQDKFISAFVRAKKPAKACCAPGCCS